MRYSEAGRLIMTILRESLQLSPGYVDHPVVAAWRRMGHPMQITRTVVNKLLPVVIESMSQLEKACYELS